MYVLGLDFSLRKLIQIGPTAGVIAVIECSMMAWFGYTIGQLFGWTTLESVYAGAVIAISSTTIIVKAFAEQNTTGSFMDIVFAAALLALAFGYSVALGAFIAGSLVAESGEAKVVEHLITPVRDMFAAIFFVAVGMMIDPAVLAQYWFVVVVLTLAVIAGKTVAVSSGGVLAGYGIRTSVQAEMSLTQIGEFSFIIAGLGLTTGATGDFLYPVAIAVSAITTPWLIRASEPAAAFVNRKLPKLLQMFVALYGSWLERLRSAPAEVDTRPQIRRATRKLLLDAALLVALVIDASLEVDRITGLFTASTAVSRGVARSVFVLGAAAVAIPLIVGFIRSAGVLGQLLALRAMPAVDEGAVDLAAAPRRALVVTLQLGIVCLVGAPLVAITQPFLSPLRGTAVLVGVLFWRGATNLHGHARAGAEVIVAERWRSSIFAASPAPPSSPSCATVSALCCRWGGRCCMRATCWRWRARTRRWRRRRRCSGQGRGRA